MPDKRSEQVQRKREELTSICFRDSVYTHTHAMHKLVIEPSRGPCSLCVVVPIIAALHKKPSGQSTDQCASNWEKKHRRCFLLMHFLRFRLLSGRRKEENTA